MWVKEDCQLSAETVAGVVMEEITSFYETMNRLYGKNN